MADSAVAESAEVELEAKRKADGSWHPCHVSLCSGGGLYVKFEGQVSEDTILDIEDALVCLRVRSLSLQGDDCCYIEEGNHVLAACEKNFGRLFFDAVVQKTIRVRHSKRASCRCTFMIKWISDHENGISSISSSSIMKLATKSIKSHPVVAAFLNSMERSYLSTSSTSPKAFDDDDIQSEIDFHGLLKHIERIGGPASKKEFLNDTLLGVDHATTLVLRRNSRNHWQINSYDVSYHLSFQRFRVFGSDSSALYFTDSCLVERDGRPKLVASEKVSKCFQVNCGSNQLRRSGRRQSMQPTIENLMNAAPSSTETSVKDQSPLSPLAARAVLASLVSEGSGTHTVNKVETDERGASGKKLHARKLNGTLLMEVCSKIEPSIGSGGSLSSSVRDEESTLPVVASRVTRSAMKKESANANGDDETTISAEEATIVQATRSAYHKGKGNLAVKVSEKMQSKVKSTRSTCYGIKKETEASNLMDKNGILDEGAKCTILNSTVRVTRSTARAGNGNMDDKDKELLRAKAETESTQADTPNSGYEATVSTNKRTFPLINAEPKFAESCKKQKGINSVERKQTTTVEDLCSSVDTQSQKKPNSSKNQPSRFSPRLRFSPCIQSHDKS